MALVFPTNIRLNLAAPLDARQVVANAQARQSLGYVYEGLIVFEQDTKDLYVAYKIDSTSFGWRKIEAGQPSDIFLKGYYLNNKFYTDTTYQTELEKREDRIYIDLLEFKFYRYLAETGYLPLLRLADAATPGIMKLYNEPGNNTDGTISQKVITEGISEIGLEVEELGDEDGDEVTDYALVLDLPWD